MAYRLLFQPTAKAQLAALAKGNREKHAKVLRCLGRLETDPRYPGVHSHRYEDLDEVLGEKIWESYVENKTPAAFRVFWHFGPGKNELTIVAITPHP